MHIDANQILYLFFCRFKEYGMKSCKTYGIIAINILETMFYSFYVQFSMNETNLICACDASVDAKNRTLSITFSPRNKFDIYNLILPGNQDPSVIQKTHNLLHTELSKDTFNITYKLTFEELSQLHTEFLNESN